MLSEYKIFLHCAVALILMAGSAQAAQPRHADGRTSSTEERGLSDEQRRQAERILEESRPRVQHLKQQIRAKVLELKMFMYDSNTDPAVLPRMGRELQVLRDELRQALNEIDARLAREAGILISHRRGRGCSGLGRNFYQGCPD